MYEKKFQAFDGCFLKFMKKSFIIQFDFLEKNVYNIDMDSILVKINALYDSLGNAEKKIADYVLKNQNSMISLSISELAELSGSSEATIVRFSKKLGCCGYQEFKLAIAAQGNYHVSQENISPSDTPKEVFEKVCSDIYASLEKTKQVINDEVFTAACQCILSAKRIVIFGLGNSASVAADMAHKLLRLGFDAVSYSDNHMQAIAAAHLNKECVVIAFSHSGSSKDIIEALRTAKANGCPTIAITNKGNSPIYKVSTYVINTNANENNYTLLGLSSRISQLAIVDCIYYYTACQISDSNIILEKTLNALSLKKY